MNDYYDVSLKFDRLSELGINSNEAEIYSKRCTSDKFENFEFIRLNLEDKEQLPALFFEQKFDAIINLAAQAGVRYSLI